MRKLLILFLLLSSFAIAQPTVPIGSVRTNGFTFTFPTSELRTSAGVYLNGVLIRTLWANKAYASGSHTEYWDGRDDLGNVVTYNITYQVVILANNLNYLWEGTVGNNSTNQSGATKWASYGGTLSDMVNVGSSMYCTMWFSEYTAGQMKFNKSTPNQQTNLNPGFTAGQGSLFTCASPNYIFYGGTSYTHSHNYIFAIRATNEQQVIFSSGVVENPFPAAGRTYNSVLDLNILGSAGVITGMAVQQGGNGYLYVAHAAQNIINVYKTGNGIGSFVRSITITNPTNLEFEGDGTLWIAQGTTLTKYTINTDATITPTSSVISGFARIAGVDVLGGDLCVLDAGNQQVVKRYNSTTLSSTGTIGQVGGYSTSPTVANNKFYEEDLNAQYYTFVRHQSDGTIWICDPGNCRYQHFDASGTYINNIMFLQQQYDTNVCLNQNTAVFSNFLEYTIDYTKPLASGWTLTNNWQYGIPSLLVPIDPVLPIKGIIKMSNTRRYAIFKTKSNLYYYGELTTSGVRYITTPLPVNPRLDSLGNLYINNSSGTYPNQSTIYQKYTLTGFSSNNPVYSSVSTYANIPLGANSAYADGGTYTQTNSGNIILFNSTTITHGGGPFKWFHLSGFSTGLNKMIFKTSPETYTSYNGIIPSDGSYDTGNRVQGAGGAVTSISNNIFWDYRGEFWRSLETGIFYHFNGDGLPLGTFGVVGSQVVNQPAPAGYAGNILSLAAAQIADTVFLYNNDEEHNSGVHRWKITGYPALEQTVNVTTTNRVFTSTSNETDLLLNYPSGWSSSPVDYSLSSSDYFTTVSGTQSSDSRIFSGNHIGAGITYTKTCSLPSPQSTSLNIKGIFDLSQFWFQSSHSGTPAFTINVLDNTGKIICQLEGFTDLTFKFNGDSHGSFGPALPSKVGYGESRFVIKRFGSQVMLSINLFGTQVDSYQSVFQSGADINNATSIQFKWVFGSVNIGGAQVGLKELKAIN